MRPVIQARRERQRLRAIDAAIRSLGGPDTLAERTRSAIEFSMEADRPRDALLLLRGIQTMAIAVARPAAPITELSDEQLAAQRQAMLDHLVLSGELEATIRRLVRDRRLDAHAVTAWVAESADAGTGDGTAD